MNNMFNACNSLTNLDLSSFNTENVINMESIFEGCDNLKILNTTDEKLKDALNEIK